MPVHHFCTAQNTTYRLTELPPLALGSQAEAPASILVDPDVRYQEIEGFGGAFIDFVRRTALANGALTVESVEVSQVMIIYVLLILGAVLAFSASLTASRFFAGIGGGIVFIGLILCLVWLPGIMAQAQHADDYLNLIRSLGWGWCLATAGMILILASSLLKVR